MLGERERDESGTERNRQKPSQQEHNLVFFTQNLRFIDFLD